MTDHASCILKAYSSLQNLSEEQILKFGRNQNKDENPIPSFDENLLINLCLDAKNVLENDELVLKITGDVIIVGDIHGSFHDLLQILHYVDQIPFKIIFLGDYIDRGQFSLECITLLFALKIMYPNKYYLLRGNHEFNSMCSLYGFKKEILNYHNPKKLYHIESDQPSNITNENEKEEPQISTEQLCDDYYANHINMNCYKYSEKLYDSFMRAFSYLPIASIVNETTLCIHGGLSPLLDKIDKIESQIHRPINDYDENPLLCDILWGDPSIDGNGLYTDNPRGRGKLFNGVVVVNFLKNNNLHRLIRAHECVFDGIQEIFNDKCITVFSASSYSYDMSNNCGILKIFQKDDTIEKVIFNPIKRLKKCDAVYYKVQAFNNINIRKCLLPIKLKSIGNFGFSDLIKESNHVNLSKLSNSINARKNGLSGKHFTFKTGIHSKKIKQCCSVPVNVNSLSRQCELLNFKSNDDSSIKMAETDDHLPMLAQKEYIKS